MSPKAAKLLVVESDDALSERISAVLREAGYEVSADYRQGMRSVLEFEPDIVVLGADPPQLDCCDLLSEIKGSESTHNIRVVMLSPGGSGERTRGLDLGADDVVSLPFDPHELLSRVRAQLKSKQTLDEFRGRVQLAEDNRNTAQEVVTAVKEERRTLRIGGLIVIGLLIVGGLLFFLFYRRAQEQNTQVYAAITRLQRGALTQQQLIERSREELARDGAANSDAQKLQLQKTSEDLKSKIAAGKAEDAAALRTQLTTVESRLEKLETDGKFAQTIIRSYEPSVCLLHIV